MPLLKYICANCGKIFEELVAIGGEPDVRCPECGDAGVSRYYRGKCLFGMKGSSAGSVCSGGNCSCCNGCS